MELYDVMVNINTDDEAYLWFFDQTQYVEDNYFWVIIPALNATHVFSGLDMAIKYANSLGFVF